MAPPRDTLAAHDDAAEELAPRGQARTARAAPLAGPLGQREASLAHLSDLHLGSGEAAERLSLRLSRALEEGRIDHAVITGDVTHRGRREELARFLRIFRPLLARGALTVLPGNHDRMTDDVGALLGAGRRVRAVPLPGLWLIAVDSTAPHNRALHKGHGVLHRGDLDAIDGALSAAPADALRVLSLHHHPLPLPAESLDEAVACALGLPWCAELRAGRALLEMVAGRCDLLLHGHRHLPAERTVVRGLRPLRVFNAGRSPQLGRFRVFRHRAGALLGAPSWRPC